VVWFTVHAKKWNNTNPLFPAHIFCWITSAELADSELHDTLSLDELRKGIEGHTGRNCMTVRDFLLFVRFERG
jgi:hypothetical protein